MDNSGSGMQKTAAQAQRKISSFDRAGSSGTIRSKDWRHDFKLRIERKKDGVAGLVDHELGDSEHGGEPDSVKFCHRVGLTYVSCSPYRVPVARLAAAQAAIEEKRKAKASAKKK
jgi:hypothetical protein